MENHRKYRMIKGYKSSVRRNLKRKQDDLLKKVAQALEKQGIVETIAATYLELYNLKKQLMAKRIIEPEASYLLAEIYESFEENNKPKK